MWNEQKNQEQQEALELRGIGVELKKLKYPRISNLNNFLLSMGYKIVHKNGRELGTKL